MRYLFLLSLVCATHCLGASSAQQDDPASSNRRRITTRSEYSKEARQARDLASQALEGRQVVVRLYKDWKKDPRAYEVISVPVDDLEVRFDSVRLVFVRGIAPPQAAREALAQAVESARGARFALDKLTESTETTRTVIEQTLDSAGAADLALSRVPRAPRVNAGSIVDSIEPAPVLRVPDVNAPVVREVRDSIPDLRTLVSRVRESASRVKRRFETGLQFTHTTELALAEILKLKPEDQMGMALPKLDEAAGALRMACRQSRAFALLTKSQETIEAARKVAPALKELSELLDRAMSAPDQPPQSEDVESWLSNVRGAVQQTDIALLQTIESARTLAPLVEQAVQSVEVAVSALESARARAQDVARVFDKMLPRAVLVVMAEDQKDSAVATVVSEYVFAEPYEPSKGRFSIWPKLDPSYRHRSHVFTDLRRNPIPNATVEIMIGRSPRPSDGSPRVSIGKAKLDEYGRPRPLKSTSTYCGFSFLLSHTDYGADSVEAQWQPFGGSPVITRWVSVLPKGQWCVFKDAVGNPIPGARVEILHGAWDLQHQKPNSRESVELDEKGRLKPPKADPRLLSCSFILSHPDYGIALLEPNWKGDIFGEPLSGCTVPLVPADTKADERSIWGFVVDANDKPVAGATLECGSIATPGGGRISRHHRYSGHVDTVKVLTDDRGEFAMYLPIESDNNEPPKLLPASAVYAVSIKPPENLGLAPYHGQIPAGQETTITLEPAKPETYFPTFVFEDEFGPVTDPNMLKRVKLTIRWGTGHGRQGSDGFYDRWLARKKFVPGTYSARADWNGKHYVFEPAELTPESPQVIVFKPKEIRPASFVYRGQVVHGITGRPMQGVIVLMGGFPMVGEDGSVITQKEWDLLRSYAADATAYEEPMKKPLDKWALSYSSDPNRYADAETPAELMVKYNFESVALTNEDGWYHLVYDRENDPHFEMFVAIAPDWLGARQRRRYYPPRKPGNSRPIFGREFEQDEEGYVDLPIMRLFPAGTILVEPNVPDEEEYQKILLRWSIDPNENPPWVREFLSHFKGTNVVYHERLRPPNRMHSVHLPAGARLNLRMFNVGQHELCPVVIRDVKVEQGQVLDLGRRDFKLPFKVKVKVVDSAGNPVEGVAVVNLEKGLYGGYERPITDEDGIALVNVVDRSAGEFVVVHPLDNVGRELLREGVPYEIVGEEDAGRQFVLQLSDEMLLRLFK
ncbi:MAG: Ig-like domain-containing protein [Phycisphaerales bacterium]|nr:MAG: Ig-like domain-containing protein [Phycisphaerales bacterium]